MILLDNYFLRPIDTKDLSWCKKLRIHPETWPYLGSFTLINDFKQKVWFEKVSQDPTQEYLIFGNKQQRIGYVRLTEIDRINRSMCVGGDIIPSQRGKGHGHAMFSLIFRLGFYQWHMNRLWLLVLENNTHAVGFYKKLGFVLEGIQRQAIFRNGKFLNYLMMSFLEEEYRKSNV